jgi:hypothetical protein
MPPLPPQVPAASSSFIDFQVKAKRHYKSREWEVTYSLGLCYLRLSSYLPRVCLERTVP